MSRKHTVWTTSIIAAAGIGLASASQPAAQPVQQHQEHHPQVAAQETAVELPAMCQEMMAAMHEHMATMRQMMSHTNSDQEAMDAGAAHPMMAAPGGGMMGDMAGMVDHMMGMMAMMGSVDPASIDDAAVAEERAQALDGMAERMSAHIEALQTQAQALRKRAAELR